jgi:hypothetical protein
MKNDVTTMKILKLPLVVIQTRVQCKEEQQGQPLKTPNQQPVK